MNEAATEILNALRIAGSQGLLVDELMDRLGFDAETITTTLNELTSEGLIMQKQELRNEQVMVRAQISRCK